MSVLDVKRGGVPYDCGVAFKAHKPGTTRCPFALPLNLFNDGDFKIIATMRIIPDTSNPKISNSSHSPVTRIPAISPCAIPER